MYSIKKYNVTHNLIVTVEEFFVTLLGVSTRKKLYSGTKDTVTFQSALCFPVHF